MLELISGVWSDAPQIDQFRVGHSAQRALEILISDRMNRLQQFVGKFAANHGADLDDLLRRPEPIQPSHQRIM